MSILCLNLVVIMPKLNKKNFYINKINVTIHYKLIDFILGRGISWYLSNQKPPKLRDTLREVEVRRDHMTVM